MQEGQEHKRSMQGTDTDAQDQPPPFIHIRLATHGRSIQMGQNRKSSSRAYVFRFAPKNGHRATSAACPFRANNGSRHAHSITSSARASSAAKISATFCRFARNSTLCGRALCHPAESPAHLATHAPV